MQQLTGHQKASGDFFWSRAFGQRLSCRSGSSERQIHPFMPSLFCLKFPNFCLKFPNFDLKNQKEQYGEKEKKGIK